MPVACASEFFLQDRVGGAQASEPVSCHLAQAAHAEAWTREWLPPDHGSWEPKRLANSPYLILEEITQRLDQLELHVLRQATHVVVRLDALSLVAVGRG